MTKDEITLKWQRPVDKKEIDEALKRLASKLKPFRVKRHHLDKKNREH